MGKGKGASHDAGDGFFTIDEATPVQSDLFGEGVEEKAPVNLSRIQRRIIEAATDIATPNDVIVVPEFLHSVLCQISLPRNNTPERSFERSSGQVSIKIKAGEIFDGRTFVEQPMPYGSRPRLILVHVCSQAVRTQSRDIEVGKSAREFLIRLGIKHSTGGKNGSYTLFRKQMLALAACEMLIGYPTPQGVATIKAPPISKFEAWMNPTEGQAVMWPGVMTLSHEFYDSLKEHAVPLRQDALAAIKHSALAIDIYTWLAHRLCRVRKAQGVAVYWTNLKEQFGQEYHDMRDFKKEFKQALRQARAVYPDAKIEEITGGLLLKASPPPIPKTQVLVRLPSKNDPENN